METPQDEAQTPQVMMDEGGELDEEDIFLQQALALSMQATTLNDSPSEKSTKPEAEQTLESKSKPSSDGEAKTEGACQRNQR